MSVCFVVLPVMTAAWPMIAAAVAAGSAGLGYKLVSELEQEALALSAVPQSLDRGVNLVMEHSEVMADAMTRGESLAVEREGIRATFRRDGRGQCTVHLTGAGKSHEELQAAGLELMDRVRQQYAYARVMDELEQRGFDVVQEQVEADQSIRVSVRRWR